uniref:tRNA (guanine(10)-N(2))-methyltransferase n=1 Tax=Eutreptiella gymnastica TaxID=73025 RepID=A0A7S4G2F7_9EUGL
MVKLLVFFVFEESLLDFRIPELQSVADLLHVTISWEGDLDPESVFLLVEFASLEGAKAVADRCVLVRGLFELWAQADDYPALINKLRQAPHLMEEHFTQKTFKYVIESFGRSNSRQQQLDIIDQFHVLEHGGEVLMQNPDTIVWVFEDIGRKMPATAVPKQVYYTREVHLSAMHKTVLTYDLKRRPYLGTTSMPSQLSFLMANMAGVNPHTLVIDCFCGTASLLVAAAYLRAHCWGVEIDPRTLRGRIEGLNVMSNFRHYGLPIPEFVRGDMARRFFWRCPETFDAILTDPPYGARAGSRKVNEKTMEKIMVTSKEGGFTSAPIIPTEAYQLGDMLTDLLDFAAKTLRISGRLVFWLPTTELYSDAELPSHPCLKLLYNTEQYITIRLRRRLLTFEKIKLFEGEVPVSPQFNPDMKHLEYESDKYLSYKAKVEKKRKAVERYKAEQGIQSMTRNQRRRAQREKSAQQKEAQEGALTEEAADGVATEAHVQGADSTAT